MAKDNKTTYIIVAIGLILIAVMIYLLMQKREGDQGYGPPYGPTPDDLDGNGGDNGDGVDNNFINLVYVWPAGYYIQYYDQIDHQNKMIFSGVMQGATPQQRVVYALGLLNGQGRINYIQYQDGLNQI